MLVSADTGILVQGITGRQGAFHAGLMLEYGARVVAGVVPGRGGQAVHGVPVFNTVEEAAAGHAIDAGVVFVPPFAAADAVCEQVDAGIDLVVVITEGIPVLDSARMLAYARARGSRILGPNCPGLILPGQTKLGIIPGDNRAPRQGRGGFAVGNPHLRSHPGPHRPPDRPGSLPGNRRRSDQGPVVRRRAGDLRGRSGRGRNGANRRDRRTRRGAGRRIHHPGLPQTGGGIRCRGAPPRRSGGWVMPARSFPAAPVPPRARSPHLRQPEWRSPAIPITWAIWSRPGSDSAAVPTVRANAKLRF